MAPGMVEPEVFHPSSGDINHDFDSIKRIVSRKPALKYLPGRTDVDWQNDDFYEHEHLLPAFPNLHWNPIGDIPYQDKGLRGDPQFRNLLSRATDVFDYNPKIGTEVHGVNLATLSDAQKDDLARLVSIRGVVFFRHQTDLDIDAQRRFGSYYGTLHKHATTSIPRRPGLEDVHVVYTDGTTNDQRAKFTPTFLWHSDVSAAQLSKDAGCSPD